MQITVATTPAIEVSCDTFILFLSQENTPLDSVTATIDKTLSEHISTLILEQPDCNHYGKTNIIHTWGALGAKRIMLLGMGRKKDLTLDTLRALSATGMRIAQKNNAASVAISLSNVEDENQDHQSYVQAIVEGAILGTYQFNYYKTQKPTPHAIQELILIENESAQNSTIAQGVHIGTIIADSVNVARDLVNHPAQYMTPSQMAVQAQDIAKENNLDITILDQADMANENMHALLAVAQGSAEPPKMIVLKYMGDPNSQQITAFVGKGITFDSGGISIKPSLNMGEMKGDMAGGAAVLAAMQAIGTLKPAVNIIGIVPCAENMPSSQAYRPGDVISSMSGKTIEIISTDAEGRLILADAITYACKLGATQIIDIATLTGACVIALGNVASGLITNNRSFCQQLLTASTQVGEKMWELPNFPEYKEQLKSPIADLKNSGGRMAGAITAGLFIAEFVAGDIPWIHIDIAGTSSLDKENGYDVKGATGVATRSLIQLAVTMNP